MTSQHATPIHAESTPAGASRGGAEIAAELFSASGRYRLIRAFCLPEARRAETLTAAAAWMGLDVSSEELIEERWLTLLNEAAEDLPSPSSRKRAVAVVEALGQATRETDQRGHSVSFGRPSLGVDRAGHTNLWSLIAELADDGASAESLRTTWWSGNRNRAGAKHALADRLAQIVGQAPPSAVANPAGVAPLAGGTNGPAQTHLRGRQRERDHLDEWTFETSPLHPRLKVVTGPPGSGKSQLVAEFCRTLHTVLWVRASTPQALAEDLARIAGTTAGGAQNLAVGTIADIDDLLTTHSGWVLVFDDAPDVAAVMADLPEHRNGHTIVTSRSAPSTWHRLDASVLDLGLLAPKVADQLLQDLTADERTAITARANRSPRALRMGRLAALRLRSVSNTSKRSLELLSTPPDNPIDPHPTGGHHPPVFWLAHRAALEHRPAGAVAAIERLALLAPCAVPEQILDGLGSDGLTKMVADLVDSGLVSHHPDQGTVEMSDSVQREVAPTIQTLKKTIEQTATALLAVIEAGAPVDLSHATTVLEWAESHDVEQPIVPRLRTVLATELREQGSPARALLFHERAIEEFGTHDLVREQALAQRELAITQAQLATLERAENTAALALHTLVAHASAVAEPRRAPDIEVARTQIQLALIVRRRGDRKLAAELLQAALDALPEDAIADRTLAQMWLSVSYRELRDKGNPAVERAELAVELSADARVSDQLAIEAKITLGRAIGSAGDLRRSVRVLEEAVAQLPNAATRDRLLAPSARSHLALALARRGRAIEGTALARTAHRAIEQAVGPGHPAGCFAGLALARNLVVASELHEALAVAATVKRARVDLWGADDPRLVRICVLLARVHADLGQHEAAEAEADEAKHLAPFDRHRPTRRAGEAIFAAAIAAEARGDLHAAESDFENATWVSSIIRGPKHPATMATIQEHATLSHLLGRPGDALVQLDRIVEFRDHNDGLGDVRRARVRTQRAAARLAVGDTDGAAADLDDADRICQLAVTKGWVDRGGLVQALVLHQMGIRLLTILDRPNHRPARTELEEARRLFEQAYAIRTKRLGPDAPAARETRAQLDITLQRKGNLPRVSQNVSSPRPTL